MHLIYATERNILTLQISDQLDCSQTSSILKMAIYIEFKILNENLPFVSTLDNNARQVLI